MQLWRQWLGSGPPHPPSSPAPDSAAGGPSLPSQKGDQLLRPGQSPGAPGNGDMRGRGSSSSVLGSGLGLGFGVVNSAPSSRAASGKSAAASWASFEKLARPWLSLCRQLPPLATLGLVALAFLTLSCLLVWAFNAAASWVPSAASVPVSLVYRPRATYPLPDLSNLIMVAGHSVYTSTSCDPYDAEKSWFLEPYQERPGQARTFIDHIRVGVRLAAADPLSLLLFSGGETRKTAGPRSEGQSYWFVAEGSKWFGKEEVAHRAMPEEYARDSFENLLFSMCRFRELTGRYPQNVTVVSYDFKQQRFMGAHRTALRFPANRFLFYGTPMVAEGREEAKNGEASTLVAFKKDPYGCLGKLKDKRTARDPFARTIPYPLACPELSAIFSYCGKHPFRGRLPWDTWRKSRKSLG